MSTSLRRLTLTFCKDGSFCVAGALALSASGIDFDKMQIVDGWKMAAPLYGILPPGLLMLFQKSIGNFSDRCLDHSNIVKRSLAKAFRYPVALSSAINLTGTAGLAKSAWNSGDLLLGAAAAAWTVGQIGLTASDPRLQSVFRSDAAANKRGPVPSDFAPA